MERTSWAMKSVIMLLYMVVTSTTGIHTVISTSHNTTPTTAPANEDRMTLAVRFNLSISMTFVGELENSSSDEYLQLARDTKETLNDVCGGLHGFLSVVINTFREGSVVVDYDLQFGGETNLTMLLDDFAQRLERLEQATINGSSVTVDANTMNDQFKKAATLQETGNICDVAKCNNGYVCRNGFSSCIHICVFFYNICLDKGGCLYDPVRDEALCRCTDGAVFLENACQYQQSGQSSLNLGAIIGGSIGGIVVVGGGTVCILIWACCPEIMKTCKNSTKEGCQRFAVKHNCNCCNNVRVANKDGEKNKPSITTPDGKKSLSLPANNRSDAGFHGEANKNDEKNSKRDDGVGSVRTGTEPPPYSMNDPLQHNKKTMAQTEII